MKVWLFDDELHDTRVVSAILAANRNRNIRRSLRSWQALGFDLDIDVRHVSRTALVGVGWGHVGVAMFTRPRGGCRYVERPSCAVQFSPWATSSCCW